MSYNEQASRLLSQAATLVSLGNYEVAKEALNRYDQMVNPQPQLKEEGKGEGDKDAKS